MLLLIHYVRLWWKQRNLKRRIPLKWTESNSSVQRHVSLYSFFLCVAFIQENESTMNILLGVLCTAVACHPGVQNKVLRIGEESGIVKRNDILKLFNVPNSAKKHTG